MEQPAMSGYARQVSYRLNDADESVAVGSQLFYHHTLKPLSTSPFHFELHAGQLGSVMVGELTYASAVAIEVGAMDNAYGISFPSDGGLELAVGHQEYVATPDHAALIGPVGEVGVRGWRRGGERLTMLRFDRRTLEAELGRHLGIEIDQRINFAVAMDLRTGRGAEWRRFARTITGSLLDPTAISWNPMLAAQLSSALMSGLLLSTEHRYREALDVPASHTTPPMIRRATRYIEENAGELITIPQIASAVGASPRTLQRGFAEHLNTTPGTYLNRVRMDRAHQALVAGSPVTTSVANIATDWGFFHQGRFAAQYRALYGRTPSATLAGR